MQVYCDSEYGAKVSHLTHSRNSLCSVHWALIPLVSHLVAPETHYVIVCVPLQHPGFSAITGVVVIHATIFTVSHLCGYIIWPIDWLALCLFCLVCTPLVSVIMVISCITVSLVIIISSFGISFRLNLPFSFKKICSALSHVKKYWSLKIKFSKHSWLWSKPAISLHFSKYRFIYNSTTRN